MSKSILYILFCVFINLVIPLVAFANYDPHTGRFLTRDPLGTEPSGRGFANNTFNLTEQYTDGMNLYEYVGGCPTVIIDNLGLRKFSIWSFEFDIPIPTGVCYEYNVGVTEFKIKNWKRDVIDDELGMGSITSEKISETIKEGLNAAYTKNGWKQDDGSYMHLPFVGKRDCPTGSCCKKLITLNDYKLWIWLHKKYWIDIGWSEKGTKKYTSLPKDKKQKKEIDVKIEFDLGLRLIIKGYFGICIS